MDKLDGLVPERRNFQCSRTGVASFLHQHIEIKNCKVSDPTSFIITSSTSLWGPANFFSPLRPLFLAILQCSEKSLMNTSKKK